ncbi:MAG: adenylate/guanylate cyclase domain-containing protein [Sphingobacteriales bacterium]|nr:MAG: adenylate/guanylate cyclase domain-containing protein [Sphingobacteriales bacterium]
MNVVGPIKRRLSAITRYRYRWVAIIAFAWTLIDIFLWLRYMRTSDHLKYGTSFTVLNTEAVLLRLGVVAYMSWVMGYLLVFRLKGWFRDYPMVINLVLKTCILLLASIVMNVILHFFYSLIILNTSLPQAWQNLYHDSSFTPWFWNNNIVWITIFILTQLLIEINEKYSPGVYMDIVLGKYIRPQNEKRIIMFMDLKDSTPIAEKLGHTQYFRFIRDFIYFLSTSLLEYNGRIYQYVGDEVVVSWSYSKENVQKCLDALIDARRRLQKHSTEFKRKYGLQPEFRVGIHVGDVTVGEIGVIKRDLAMSGDTMNTTARIRTACSELNQKFIVSKDFADELNMKAWQCESLGTIDLKGKRDSIELFALNI